jgi:hypothetical protein
LDLTTKRLSTVATTAPNTSSTKSVSNNIGILLVLDLTNSGKNSSNLADATWHTGTHQDTVFTCAFRENTLFSGV